MAAVSGYVAFRLALSFSVPSTLPPALGWPLFILYYHAYLLLAGRVFIGVLFRPHGEAHPVNLHVTTFSVSLARLAHILQRFR